MIGGQGPLMAPPILARYGSLRCCSGVAGQVVGEGRGGSGVWGGGSCSTGVSLLQLDSAGLLEKLGDSI